MTRVLANPVIILLGPTCVGKTGLSLLLAKKLKSEIISADSMLVYRHMDIGTAKPSTEELNAVPHHLINILEPHETFSAGVFKEEALKIISELHGRNKVPVIVGGTGLYIRALTRGLFEGPGADQSLREQLKMEEDLHGNGHLYRILTEKDPEAAEEIAPNDLRRVIRALEVTMMEDRRISALKRESTKAADYDFLKVGLTRDRKELYGMIEERVEAMMDKGLLGETEKLLARNPGETALQALGYKELVLFLSGRTDLDGAVRLIKKRTKMYAKRQMTWFRKEPDIHWVDVTGMWSAGEMFQKVAEDIEILSEFIYS